MHVKQASLVINEFAGQLQAVKLTLGVQTKVGRQLHCLEITFAVRSELATLPQGTHPKILSTYEFASGHSHTPVSALNTKFRRQPQTAKLVGLINPVPFFPFNVEHTKQLPFVKNTEFGGQTQAGVFKVGVHTKVLSIQMHFLFLTSA